MSLQIWINGTLYPKADAKISVYDHGLLYGDGVFEGLRSYSGKIFRLEQHLQRLEDSARAICLQIPYTAQQIREAMYATLKANQLEDGYIRLVVTRGSGALGLDPNKCSDPQVIVITDKISLYPAEYYQHGMAIVTAATIRNHPAALSPRIKSLNYLNNILAKMEALQAGCVEAVMLNHKGEVAECTGDNIFIVRNGVLTTPSEESGVLSGITRDAVIELAQAAGIQVERAPLTRHDLFVASECFLTGTAAEVIPVVKIDNRVIGSGKPGSTTLDLIERFHRMVRS